jgi:hypothetical protein
MRTVLAALVLASATMSAGAQTDSPEDLARRTIERRAVEAAIWGMPAVSMVGVRKSLAGIGADYNQVVYFSQPLEARHEFLTANNQTPYVMTVLDLRRGPVVVDVQPASSKVALFGSAIDSWQVPLVDLGPSGDDAGKGGKYLFLPPGYTGSRPDGHIVIPSPTIFVHVALRPIILGQGTLADGVAYSQTLKVYPLTEAANPQTRYIDAYPKPWKTLPVYDLTYFRDLAAVVNDEPALERDAVMLGLLASIGIEKGKPFNPTGEHARTFERTVQDAYATMQDYFTTPGKALVPHWPDRLWMASHHTQTQDFTFVVDGKLLVDERAGGFALWATWLPKKLGAASAYPTALRDGAGKLLSGQNNYRLRVPADTPARDFWSVIVYSMKTKSMIPNPQSRSGLSSYDKSKLSMNADGSVDLYFGPTAPSGKEANWLPTGEDFFLIFRLYGPGKAYFDKTWKMDDIEQVN